MHYADTYALVEILRGNPAYKSYTRLVTSEFNLLELAYAVTRDYGEDIALQVLDEVRKNIVIIYPDDRDYVEAALFKISQRRAGRNVSLVDALGYVLAKKIGVPFLTGDKAFKGLENVEYVK